jgi:hypothetical protein
MSKARADEVGAELDALVQEGRARSRDDLQQVLKTLRSAVNAWTAYDLVKKDVTVPFA